MAKVFVTVEAEVPGGVTFSEWLEYVHESVVANVGSKHPSDHLFHLDRDSVVVSMTRQGKRVKISNKGTEVI